MSGVRFHPAARREYQAAILLHERERPGHGQLFIAAVDAAVERASKLPASGAPVPAGHPPHEFAATSSIASATS